MWSSSPTGGMRREENLYLRNGLDIGMWDLKFEIANLKFDIGDEI